MSKPRPYARHILLRGSVYYFRMAVPLDLRARVGVSEVRLSLRTGYARKALIIARRLVASGDALYESIRSGEMSYMPDIALKKIINSHFRKRLDEFQDKLIGHEAMSPERLQKMQIDVDAALVKSKDYLARGCYEAVNGDAMELINDSGLDRDDASLVRNISHELLKMYADLSTIFAHRVRGEYNADDLLLAKYEFNQVQVSTLPANSADAGQSEDMGMKLFELIDKYCEFKISTGAWTGRGVEENPKNYEKIKFILGDMPLKDITVETAMHMLDCLKKLPTRMTSSKYQGLTLEQLIEMDHKTTMAAKTINSRMEEASSLMKQAMTWGYVDRNCFDGVKIKDVASDEDRRLPFTTEDIRSIFKPDTFLPYCTGRPAHYWVPILALYTGARLEELAQLLVEDVYEIDGVLVLDINDKEGKRLKNKNARRKIPIVDLVRCDLGFEAFVEAQKVAGEVRLFSELPYNQKRYGHSLSKDFGRYLTKIKMGPKKSFHSFRHTFIDFLRNKDIRDDHIASMTGHGDTKNIIPRNYRQKHWIYFVVEKVANFIEFDVEIPKLRGGEDV